MAQASGLTDNVIFRRVLFTVGILVIFRLGVHIPTPGIDTKELAQFASQQGGLLRILNMFSGGALNNFSIFGLGVMPYISASIIFTLMTPVLPILEQMQKEGGVGRQKITRMTRALALFIALIQGYFFSAGLEMAQGTDGGRIVLDPGVSFRVMSALLLASGSCFVMWLGEQITEKGIGNGISVIIFGGIVAYLPATASSMIEALKQDGSLLLPSLAIVFFAIVLVFFVTFIEQSYRKVPIHYAKRVVGSRVMSAQVTHLPLKLNMAGIMAAIFASTILAIPATFNSFNRSFDNPWITDLMPGNWLYNSLFAVLGLFFSYFYTSLVFKPEDVAENLKKQNAYIPGIRPGSETAEALNAVVSRLTMAGAFYMIGVVVVPSLFGSQSTQQVALGGTSLLIVVGVALEVIRQISSHMANQQYDTLFFSDSQTDVTSPQSPRQ